MLSNGKTGGTFVAEGPRRVIAAKAIREAGLAGFTTGGITDADMADIPRRVHGADESVADILWNLRSRTKVLTVDPWREIGLRWIDDVEDSGVTLDKTTRAAFALISESARYATRVLVVAPGMRTETVVLQDGDTSIPLEDAPLSLVSITIDDVAQDVEDWMPDGPGARAVPPDDQQVLSAGNATVVYLGATGISTLVGDEVSDVHRTDTLMTNAPTVEIAQALGGGYLAQQIERRRYQAITIPAQVEYLLEGQRLRVDSREVRPLRGYDRAPAARGSAAVLRAVPWGDLHGRADDPDDSPATARRRAVIGPHA